MAGNVRRKVERVVQLIALKNGKEIHSIGVTSLKAFGIELANILEMNKALQKAFAWEGQTVSYAVEFRNSNGTRIPKKQALAILSAKNRTQK